MSSIELSPNYNVGYLSDIICDDDNGYEQFKDKINQMREESCKFADIFQTVTEFCKGGSNKGVRCQKCGLLPLDTGLLININQFKSLVRLQKSIIVSNLYKLGYIKSNAKVHTLRQILLNFPESAQLRTSMRGWVFFESKKSLSPSPTVDTIKSLDVKACSPEPSSIEASNSLERDIQHIKAASIEDLSSFFNDPFCIPPTFMFFPTTTCYGVVQPA